MIVAQSYGLRIDRIINSRRFSMIEVNHLSKHFGSVQALQDITFTAEKGKILAVSYTHLTLPTNSLV